MKILSIAIFLFAFIFIGCEKTNKIPVVMGFTSNYSEIAKEVQKGMILAQDEYNIKFKFIDNKGDKSTTKKIDEKLISKHIPLVIGHITSSVTISVVHLFNNTNTILFSPTVSTKKLANIDDNFIRTQPIKNFDSMKNVMEAIGFFTHHHLVNILYDQNNSVYSKGLVNIFLDKRDKYISINKINKINNKNIESDMNKNIPIIIIAPTKLASKITIKLKKNGFNSLIFISGSAFTQKFIELTKNYAEGVLFFSTYNQLSENKNYINFKEKFIAKFGYNPTNFNLKGYEIAKITATIINKQNIKQALINHTFQALQRDIYINKYGDTIRNSHLYVVDDQMFAKVE